MEVIQIKETMEEKYKQRKEVLFCLYFFTYIVIHLVTYLLYGEKRLRWTCKVVSTNKEKSTP